MVKKCEHCHSEKDESEFYPAPDGELSEHCKKCFVKLAYVEKQKRRKREYMRKYYRENREKILEKNREYYRKQREMRLDYQREYSKSEEGKEKHKEARKRRQERKGDEKDYTRREIIKRDSEDGQPICQICGYPVDYQDLEIDHIVPIADGGTDTKDNVRIAHKTCNVRRPRKGSD